MGSWERRSAVPAKLLAETVSTTGGYLDALVDRQADRLRAMQWNEWIWEVPIQGTLYRRDSSILNLRPGQYLSIIALLNALIDAYFALNPTANHLTRVKDCSANLSPSPLFHTLQKRYRRGLFIDQEVCPPCPSSTAPKLRYATKTPAKMGHIQGVSLLTHLSHIASDP